MKRKSIIVATLGFVLVGFGFVFEYTTNTLKNERENNEFIKLVNDNYKSIEEYMQVFNGEREKILEISNDYIDENLLYNYTNWMDEFDNYLSTLNKFSSLFNNVKEKCSNNSIDDTNITSKCQSMQNSYETAVNYFVKDVNNLNKYIDSYNESVSLDERKEGYYSEYQYIDVNDDGKYLGM